MPPNEGDVIDVSHAQKEVATRDDIWQVFRTADGDLELDESRLKARTQKDAVQRLTYLHIVARAALGKQRVSRQELMDMAKEVGLHDSNWAKVFNETTDLAVEGDEVWLRRPGRKKAAEFLREVLDEDVPDHWPITKATRGKSSRSSSAREEETSDPEKPVQRRKSGRRLKVGRYVQAWTDKAVGVNGHEALKSRKVAEQGIFALWAIRMALGDDGKEVSGGILAQFLWQAFEIRVNERSLVRALRTSPIAKDKVANVRGSTFQINPTGMAFAEGLAGAQSEALAISTNGKATP